MKKEILEAVRDELIRVPDFAYFLLKNERREAEFKTVIHSLIIRALAKVNLEKSAKK